MSRSEPSPSQIGRRFLIDMPDADLHYVPQWVEPGVADGWLSELSQRTPWSQPQIKIYGRSVSVPRLVAWYGEPEARYRYSGLLHEPLPWTPLLAEIRQRVEQHVGQTLNGVLLNLYRDGQDAMGWHSDDEPELGDQPLVASLNLGAARRFDFRRKGNSRIEHSVVLEHGSLLVMSGPTQHYWQHQIARSRKVSEPRLNLTFRQITREPNV